MVGAVSVRPELTKSSTKRDQNFKALRFWKRVLLGLWGVFSEYTSSLEWRCSYRRLTENILSWLHIPVTLILLTSTHLTSGSFKKCLTSSAVMDFRLWSKSFQDWHVCLFASPLSLSSFPSFRQCDVLKINNSVTSIARALFPIYSRFLVLLLPQLSRGAPSGKFRSGRPVAIKHIVFSCE